jgi:hypothetical protein
VALQGYREGYRVHGQELRNRLAPELRPWADRWALARVPEAREVAGAVDPPLADVIAGRLGGAGAEHNLVPADVWDLMNLALWRARDLASETPGCHLRQHREGSREISRFECSAYAPRRGDGAEGADLLVEMRVVYADQVGRLTWYDKPSEIFFLFPVPPGTQPDVHLRVVAEAVAQAVAGRWSGDFELSDRSGSALHGFVLKGENRDLTVYRPWLEPFVKERRVVAVRGEWRSP